MCIFNYWHFTSCGHFGAHIRLLCPETMFLGGWTGALPICRPALFQLSESDNNPYHNLPNIQWESINGFCRKCVDEFKLPLANYGWTYQFKQHPSVTDENFNENDQGPYFYFPELRATIPGLLDAEDWFTKNNIDMGNPILFPEEFKTGTWAELVQSMPWRNQGKWAISTAEGLSVRQAHINLGLQYGISEGDRVTLLRMKEDIGPAQFQEWFDKSMTLLRNRGMPEHLCRRLLQSPIIANLQPGEMRPWDEAAMPDEVYRIRPGDGSEA